MDNGTKFETKANLDLVKIWKKTDLISMQILQLKLGH